MPAEGSPCGLHHAPNSAVKTPPFTAESHSPDGANCTQSEKVMSQGLHCEPSVGRSVLKPLQDKRLARTEDFFDAFD